MVTPPTRPELDVLALEDPAWMMEGRFPEVGAERTWNEMRPSWGHTLLSAHFTSVGTRVCVLSDTLLNHPSCGSGHRGMPEASSVCCPCPISGPSAHEPGHQ